MLSLALVACGSSDGVGGTGNRSTALTIYSSLPLQGDARARSQAIVDGERMALAEHYGRVGRFTIKYVSLDDATATAGRWDPSVTSANARRAAQDRDTIAYLGDLDSDASAISLPVLNEVGILQVSPSNSYVGLTRSEDADKGEPDKYYPSGKRTYGRVVPTDRVQAAAQVAFQKDNGCRSLATLDDRGIYGRGVSRQVDAIAAANGIDVVGHRDIDGRAANFRDIAAALAAASPDCVFYGGVTESNAARLFKDLNAAMPAAKLFGADGVADSSFTTRLGSDVEKVTYLTDPALGRASYPAKARSFFADYRSRYGKAPESFAIYGYEAMQVVLATLQRAGAKANDRQAVVNAFFATKDRESVLGRYSIDQSGDTTLTDYGGYRVENGRPTFVKVIRAKGRP